VLGVNETEKARVRNSMSLSSFIEKRENTLISSLEEKQTAIDDRTGKGAATENIIEQQLIKPFLPLRFTCMKGAVVTSENPDQQSATIDRVIYDVSASPLLIHDPDHSIFPIESVCGLVEITMSLDACKLKEDIERMATIKAMRTGQFLVPVQGTRTKVVPHKEQRLSPRSFIIGLPSDRNWKVKTIGDALREIQIELGPPTHIHGLYVLGIVYLETIPIEKESEPMYRIRAWPGPDRLFRFSNSFRQAFDRWLPLLNGWSVNLDKYVQGQSEVVSE
jgi:hypothetical protein